jgi:hypothetical protein
MRQLLLLLWVLACVSEVRSQPAVIAPAPGARSMSSLMSEGYEIQDARLFKDKIWLRKADGSGATFICDRGRIGSAAFDAYRGGKYNEITCSPAQ